jgi:tight adherence protein G
MISQRITLKAMLRRFCLDRRGAFAASFVILSFFLLSLVALGFEGARYLNERARLSDGLEQAALALTAQDKGEDDPIAENYINAYMKTAAGKENTILNDSPAIKRLFVKSDDDGQLSYLEYKVSAQVWEDSWFSSPLFPSFGKRVLIGGSGAARKYRSSMDVMFVVDFSSSMTDDFNGNEAPNSSNASPDFDPDSQKIVVLKRVVSQLAQQILDDDPASTVGFLPFAWGEQNVDQTHCVFPFVSSNFGGAAADTLSATDAPDSNNAIPYVLRLATQIDYQATVDNIPEETNDFSFPFGDVRLTSYFCMINYTRGLGFTGTPLPNSPIPLTHSVDALDKINSMDPWGQTLISAGILSGTQMLAKGTSAKKILVIVSDGTDYPVAGDDYTNNNPDFNITDKLMKAGMCNKIRQVLSTSQSVAKIAFIGVAYNPTVDWKACVGSGNYFESYSADEFADAMHRAVFEEVGHSSLYDR